MEGGKKIFAFISYSHKDVKWAKWMRRKLEWYRLPSEAANEYDDSKYIRPVFRDRDELSSGILNESLLSKLSESEYLIVICSRNSAGSRWVSDEIQAFIDMGRVGYIIPFIVGGRNDDVNACLPSALLKWNRENPQKTILGIPVYDDNASSRSKALIRVVSRLLKLDFDVLWQRHRRERTAMMAWLSFASLSVMFMLYWFGVPVHVTIDVSSPDSSLPEFRRGVVTVFDKELAISDSDTLIDFGTLPGACRMHRIPVRFTADRFYEPYESEETLAPGLHDSFSVCLRRDNSFAEYAGTVMNEQGDAVAGALVCIGNRSVRTDSSGSFKVLFPLEEQSTTKALSVSCEGFRTVERDDECPSTDLVYLLR